MPYKLLVARTRHSRTRHSLPLALTLVCWLLSLSSIGEGILRRRQYRCGSGAELDLVSTQIEAP